MGTTIFGELPYQMLWQFALSNAKSSYLHVKHTRRLINNLKLLTNMSLIIGANSKGDII